jgi:hypothetical protein
VLTLARTTNLLFWWLLLGYAWCAGRHLAGAWGGRIVVTALACEPNLLAHASLATTDIAISACLLALVYHFVVGQGATWPRRVGLPALWFAIALTAKASALVFGPLCLLACAVLRWGTERTEGGTRPVLSALLARLHDLVQIGILGLVGVFLYCGCDGQPLPSFVAWAHRLPPGPSAERWTWVADHLCIFSNAGEALVRQIKHNLHGHGMYLLGTAHPQRVWYYFPVVLTIKLTLPVLLLTGGLLVTRGRLLLTWAGVAAGLLLVNSLTCRVQIGVRLLLPAVVLLIVAVGAALAQAGQTSRAWRMGTLVGGLWLLTNALLAWPDGLTFTNEAWGGRQRAYRYVSDSNCDWGQGLLALQDQACPSVGMVDVWYFGSDPRVEVAPLRHLPLHTYPLTTPADVQTLVRGRVLAVSTTLLYGWDLTPAQHIAAEYLRGCQPSAKLPHFHVFDFRE